MTTDLATRITAISESWEKLLLHQAALAQQYKTELSRVNAMNVELLAMLNEHADNCPNLANKLE